MARFRIDLEYVGTRYSGWQDQKNARTVQGALHEAVRQPAGARDGLERERVEARPVHAGRDVHRRGDEVLNLAGPIAVALQVEGELDDEAGHGGDP